MPAKFKTLLIIVLLLALPLTAALAATEETAQEAPQSPFGLTAFVLLLGIGAVVVVGGAMLARDNFRDDGDSA